MKNIRILIVGAVAILATASATPIVGHAEVVTTQPQSYNVEAHYDADSQGVSSTDKDYDDVDTSKDPSYVSFSESKSYGDVYAWASTNLNKVQSSSSTKSTTSTTSAKSTATTVVQSDGWNAVSADEIYFIRNGVKLTGWQKFGDWYYFGTDGKMQFDKWIQDGGNWYYISADGTMATDCLVNGYYLNSSGVYDSSKNNSSYGSDMCYTNGKQMSIFLVEGSSKYYTNSEFEALRSQGKLGAKNVTTNSNGVTGHSFEWYLK